MLKDSHASKRRGVVGDVAKVNPHLTSPRSLEAATTPSSHSLLEASKYCKACDTTKPLSAFSANRQSKDGKRFYCRVCISEQNSKRARRFQTEGPTIHRSVKRCPQCEQDKDVNAFYNVKRTPDGLSSYCKLCQNTRQRVWASAHKEQKRVAWRKYANEHKDALKERQRRWRIKNGKATEYWRKRNARVRQAEINDFTNIQWQALLQAHDYACANCQVKEDLTADHMVPLVRGDHTLENMIPLCRSCNATKGTKTLLEFVLRRAA